MLIINGTFGGKTYQNASVPPSLIASHFDLLPASPDGNTILWSKEVSTKDRFGQSRQPRSVHCVPELSISTGTDSFTIRYAERQTQGANGSITFHPRRVEIDGSFTTFKYDLFVFMCLFPYTEGSPIQSKSEAPKFVVFNAAKVEREANQKAAITTKLMDSISKEDKTVLTLKAKALGFPGNSWGEYLAHAYTLLIQDPLAFQRVWESDTTLTSGVLVRAVERGFLELKPIQGENYWVYGTNALALSGNRICKTQGDHIQDLLMFFRDPSAQANHLPKIKEMVLQEKLPTIASTMEDTQDDGQTFGTGESEQGIDATDSGDFIKKIVSTGKLSILGEEVIWSQAKGPKVMGFIALNETIEQWLLRTFTEQPAKKGEFISLGK